MQGPRAVLLRGVNVSGHNRLPMAGFRALLEGLGLRRVETWIQSGNAVFCGGGPDDRLAAAIAAALRSEFGIDTPVFLRDAPALRAALDHPFTAGADPARIHAFFLAPDAPPLDEARLAAARIDETWARRDGLVLLHTPSGLGRSRLAAVMARQLTTAHTARNLRSVAALAALMSSRRREDGAGDAAAFRVNLGPTRRCRMFRLLTAALCLIALPALGQQPDRIASHCHAVARGPDRVQPARLGEGLDQDRVLIRYLGHASFAIVTDQGTVAVTDYAGFIGRTDLVPDVATMNNAHHTHWTPNPDPRIPHLLDGWPQDGAPAQHRLDLGSMLVRNVTSDTRGPFGEGALRDGNSIFIFEAAGLCIGHLGHLHQILTDAQYAEIGRLDIVMVPVDGGYTLRLADMEQIVRRLKARVVLPMHWFNGASLREFLAGMEGEFAVVETGVSQMEFGLRDMPAQPTILVLEPRLLDE
ncbi:MAG: MBL fold metallo-hydrolase [Paracoccaceae bacterium]